MSFLPNELYLILLAAWAVTIALWATLPERPPTVLDIHFPEAGACRPIPPDVLAKMLAQLPEGSQVVAINCR